MNNVHFTTKKAYRILFYVINSLYKTIYHELMRKKEPYFQDAASEIFQKLLDLVASLVALFQYFIEKCYFQEK